ncbi:transposon Ty3-I Gag-Pol polyprotein [Trichonephila clavipes]|nr:transposon Ty3-I Gag-Pol polyprotein [Trichonephila clavipes]
MNFYHRFIPNAAENQAILNNYLKGKKSNDKNKIHWTEESVQAFKNSKQQLCKATVLVHPSENAYISLIVDASDNGIGVVLQQLEHGNLDKATPHQQRHVEYIAQFTVDVQHVPGKGNIIADALSRIDELHLQQAIDFEGIAKAQEKDEELKEILSSHNSSLKLEKNPIFGSNLDIFCNCSAKKKRLYIPEAFQRIVFNNIHNLEHPGIRTTTKLLSSKFVWPSMNKDARTWAKSCIKC